MVDFLFQIEIDEDDVDDRFRSLFGQLAGGVSCIATLTITIFIIQIIITTKVFIGL